MPAVVIATISTLTVFTILIFMGRARMAIFTLAAGLASVFSYRYFSLNDQSTILSVLLLLASITLAFHITGYGLYRWRKKAYPAT